MGLRPPIYDYHAHNLLACICLHHCSLTRMVMHCMASCASNACQAHFLRARGACLIVFSIAGHGHPIKTSEKFAERLLTSMDLTWSFCWRSFSDCNDVSFCRQELHIVLIDYEAAANLAPRTWAFVPCKSLLLMHLRAFHLHSSNDITSCQMASQNLSPRKERIDVVPWAVQKVPSKWF